MVRSPTRWLVPLLLALLVLDVAGATYAGLRLASPPAAVRLATPRPSTVPAVRRAEALAELRRMLGRRALAVLSGDRRAWLATVAPDAPALRRRQDGLFDALAALPLSRWSYEIVEAGPARPGAHRRRPPTGAWTARVLLRYRLDGFDTADVVREQHLLAVPAAGGWRFAGDAEQAWAVPDAGGVGGLSRAGRAVDLWDLGPVTVRAGRSSLVVGAAGRDLAPYVREADAAVERVSEVWTGRWPQRVVVLVPRTQQDTAAVLASQPGGLGRVAAVTTGQPAGNGAGPAGDRVVVNPATYDGLGAVGRRVVMTHETMHVATRAAGSGAVPTWLAEGFADYAAYRDSGVSPTVAARTLLAAVRAGAGPGRLPARPDFDAARGDPTMAYEGAWLACVLIARDYGEARLVALYRAVAAGGMDSFAEVIGTTPARFVIEWRSFLRELATEPTTGQATGQATAQAAGWATAQAAGWATAQAAG